MKEALKARISSNNFLKNFVVVVFDAEKAMSYYGKLTEVLISHVLVADGTTSIEEYRKLVEFTGQDHTY